MSDVTSSLSTLRDQFVDTRFRVLAIGFGTAALILWLSGSFWLDAWRQSADMRRFERLDGPDLLLQTLTAQLARERTSSLAMVDGSPTARSAFARALQRDRQQVDAALLQINDALVPVLSSSSIVPFLRDTPAALQQRLEKLESLQHALGRARERFDNRLVALSEESVARHAARSLPFALYVHATVTELASAVHELRHGFETRTDRSVPRVENLQRVRTALQDFIESESARAALQIVDEVNRSGANIASPVQLALEGAMSNARGAARQLARLGAESAVDPRLRDALHSLVDDHQRLLSAWLPIAPSINESALNRARELDQQIGREIRETVAAYKANGYRRLMIDSVLIALCFWIVFASLRLLDNIRHQARHDRLTGLPNRRYFEEHVHKSFSHPHVSGQALLMIDMDDFKLVNDAFGHAVGDELLRRLAARLRPHVAQPGMIAALGGDEFAVMLVAGSGVEDVRRFAEHLRGVCQRPLEIGGATWRARLSIGFAIAGKHADDAATLLQRAGIALRQAKDAGKDRVRSFDLLLEQRNRERLALKSDLHAAIARDELELHYQPKIDTATSCVVGAEALVRWRHQQQGLISPGRFIPLAEQSGLIVPIGNWVLNHAVHQAADWQRTGQAEVEISVNVSAEQLLETDFIDSVQSALVNSGLAADRLELEITESVGLHDMQTVVAQLTKLQSLGVRIAIDDFGTEYSSLQYLEMLPVDTLKIDRAFVTKLDHADAHRSLVNTIVLMARSFGLRTVAEGVETARQLTKVTALGVDQIQGYYYSAPVPADKLPSVIHTIDEAAHDRGGDLEHAA